MSIATDASDIAEKRLSSGADHPDCARDAAATIRTDDITLTADGARLTFPERNPQLEKLPIQTGRDMKQFGELKPPEEVTIPSGEKAAVWLLYSGLPGGPSVPKMQIELQVGERTQSLDVNAYERGVLGLKTERLGPENCLALLTIGVVDISNGFSRKLQLEQGVQRAVEKVMQTTGVLSVEDTIAREVVCQVNGTNTDGSCKTDPITTANVTVTHRLECPRLVVGEHDADEADVGVNRGGQHDAAGIDGPPFDGNPTGFELPQWLDDAGVFEVGGNDAT